MKETFRRVALWLHSFTVATFILLSFKACDYMDIPNLEEQLTYSQGETSHCESSLNSLRRDHELCAGRLSDLMYSESVSVKIVKREYECTKMENK